jgi:hypothetical protein
MTLLGNKPVSFRLIAQCLNQLLYRVPFSLSCIFYISTVSKCYSPIFTFFFFPVALRPNVGHGLLILEVSGSHTTTHHSR